MSVATPARALMGVPPAARSLAAAVVQRVVVVCTSTA